MTTVYPLVLTPDELHVLRMMIRTAVTAQLFNSVSQHSRHVLSPPGGVGLETVESTFATHVITLTDTYRELDMPLYHAASLNLGKSVCINLTDHGFEVLTDIVKKKYEIQDSASPEARQFGHKLLTVQPAIVAAFEVALEQATRTAPPANVPAAQGRN